MDRDYWARHIAGLDAQTEYEQIYQILVSHEFPWDMNQSLSFALYRTYAVPSIGRLLKQTGEFTERTQKRYDDTALILDTVLEHGMASEPGRAAIRRMNQMHGAYPISNDDKLYVLCTFVTMPIRWLDAYGWRPLTEHEKTATANYYRALGRLMDIKDIPATYTEFGDFLDRYEARALRLRRRRPGRVRGHAEADGHVRPEPLRPRAAVTRFAKALMDDPLLDAFGYRRPARWERRLAAGALRLRGRVVRRMPPAPNPVRPPTPNIRSYPCGYEVTELGTFPASASPTSAS